MEEGDVVSLNSQRAGGADTSWITQVHVGEIVIILTNKHP